MVPKCAVNVHVRSFADVLCTQPGNLVAASCSDDMILPCTHSRVPNPFPEALVGDGQESIALLYWLLAREAMHVVL